jgi:hypothetical protein
MASERRSSDPGQISSDSNGGQPLARAAQSDKPVGRRHALRALFAGIAAALGAAVLGEARPEEASADGTEGSTIFTGPISASSLNNGHGLVNAVTGFGSSGATGVAGSSDTGVAVYGNSNSGNGGYFQSTTSYGVYGQSGNSSGVYGLSTNQVGVVAVSQSVHPGVSASSTIGVGVYGLGHTYGVYGISSDPSSTGVYGSGDIYGVYGTSTHATGVQGITASASPGVYGLNTGIGPGVEGVNTNGGQGVVGYAPGAGSNGVGGGTDIGTGFYGAASSTGTGVVATSAAGTAFYALAQTAGQLAGKFDGPVTINGGLTVMGKSYKSAAVRSPSGSLVRLYCVESPESWFEDFGSGQLSNGSATVPLEPGFAGVVKTDSYHVFLTPGGDSKGLYVTNKTPNSFTVHEQQGGSSNVSFSYRLVAKRKDIDGVRLEHVDEPPNIALPKSLEMPPTPPVPPKPSEPPPIVPTPAQHGP